MKLLKSKTDQIRGRYNRIAFLYNSLEAPMEYLRFKNWRNRLMKMINGPSALEVGVGTGKNLPYYPLDVDVTAIDFSPKMLAYMVFKDSSPFLNIPNFYFAKLCAKVKAFSMSGRWLCSGTTWI